ncbi:Hypothetical protein BJL86_0331 [Dietzia timorensis]|uniref:Uncharacterized protein n=1 Tax=Dietzia timorensis TaxID=499555 RepID=A0A173LI66_9ACTN|nr:Hypothetical protein BJL86_0331 [Dietzia timorensis]
MDVVDVKIGTVFLDDDRNRALLPLGMLDPHHGGFADLWVGDDRVFHVDRGDPFAAAFDHVLDAVGQLEVAVGADRAGIAAAPPPIGERAAFVFHLVVALDDPRAAHEHLALGDTVVG